MNETHDPRLRSWLEAANHPETEFPIQNLPFGVYRRLGSKEAGRIGVAIGDRILDAEQPGTTLNELMAASPEHLTAVRGRFSKVLAFGSPRRELAPMADCELMMPVAVGDYTDFYASIHHATNVGRLFRPDNPLLPNYKYVPIGYHGRASSLVVSGTPVRRPEGQTPQFGPSQRLDYEIELGLFIGQGNRLGSSISIRDARQHVFGFCLVNDWSARDLQAWEYQPLGPFLGKSFATTVSPWIVTAEALAPFRAPAFTRAEGDPLPLDYLLDLDDQREGAHDITLEVWIETERMRKEAESPVKLSRGDVRDLYWTPAQLVTHHASNGCNLRPGDLLASGTVSGKSPEARGCLLELTSGGKDPVRLPNGETRRFLENGDEIIFRGRAQREGYVPIGFGDCRGRVIAGSNF
jgi:fumarylacetoacetase